uniref:Uncharacterized protein n=1 Tax=Cucumis sativus TaxID=3659 RepID=A0A0A0KNE9_CUCSA
MRNPFQCNLLLYSQRQHLMNCCHCPLLHPLLCFNGPHIILRNVLIWRPIRKPLPFPHCNSEILPYLKPRGKIHNERESNVLSITSFLSINPLPGSLYCTNSKTWISFYNFNVLIPSFFSIKESKELRVFENYRIFKIVR